MSIIIPVPPPPLHRSTTRIAMDSSGNSIDHLSRACLHGTVTMVLYAPVLKSPTTSRSRTVPISPTVSTQIPRQPYRRGSKGGFQTPAVDQDLALPDRVLEAILENLATEVVQEAVPCAKHDNVIRPPVSRESSQTNARTGSNQDLLLGLLSLSKTTKVRR
jgi:hypothetical protein